MSVRAIFFDLDETLMQESASDLAAGLATSQLAAVRAGVDAHALCKALLTRAGELWRCGPAFEYCRSIGISPAEGLWGTFGGAAADLATLRAWVPRYRAAAWAGALARFSVNDFALASELADSFVRERHARHVVYPETLGVLEALVRDYPLALITNGASEIQREKLARSGLSGFFREIVISGEAGVGKPNPAIFRLALSALDVAPDAAVMVGDNLNRDVNGARNAGMPAVWVNRNSGLRPDAASRPDVEVPDLAGLDRVVRDLGGRD